MKKTLLTILGAFLLTGIGFSQANIDNVNKKDKEYILGKIDNEKKFNMEENDPYCVDFKLYADKKCIIASYDLDNNDKIDVKARFSFPENGYQNALTVFVDKNEDTIPEFVYLSTNKHSQGRLETKMSYEDYLKFANYLRNKKLGREIVILKPLKPLYKNL